METVLNLIWLIVTVAALWLWRFRWLVSRRKPRACVLLEVVAMGCVLALLFPVISLTDDLHPEILAVDASSGKRSTCLLVAGATQTPHGTPISGSHLTLAVPSTPFGHVELAIAGIIVPTEDLGASSLCRSCFGRSPPFFK